MDGSILIDEQTKKELLCAIKNSDMPIICKELLVKIVEGAGNDDKGSI